MAEAAPNIAPDIVFEEDEIGAGAGDGPVDAEEAETEKVVVVVPETTAWGVVWRGMSKAQSLKAEDEILTFSATVWVAGHRRGR